MDFSFARCINEFAVGAISFRHLLADRLALDGLLMPVVE